MPDPLAIISLLDTAFRLGCDIYNFFSDLKDAPKKIHSYIEELGVFKLVLKEVEKYVTAFTVSSFVTEDVLTLEIVEITLKQCESEFRDIHDAIRMQKKALSLSILRKLGSSSSWVFDSDDRDKSTKRLNRARAALEMALSTANSRQHIIVREEIKWARNDVAEIRETQQNVLSLLHSMFVAGQERVKLLDMRAEREKSQSQIRLNDLSGKLESNFDSSYLTAASSDRESPYTVTRTAESEVEDGYKQDGCSDTYRRPSEVTYANKLSKSHHGVETLQKAFELFQSKLPSKAIEEVPPYLMTRYETKMLDEITVSENMMKLDILQHRVNAIGPLDADLCSVRRMGGVFDRLCVTGPARTLLLWGSVAIVIQASLGVHSMCDDIIEKLREVMEIIYSCRREHELYQGQRIESLMVELYTGLFTFLHRNMQIWQMPTLKGLTNVSISRAVQENFQPIISKTHQLSTSVSKEVEYLHRLEVREALLRVKNMERGQQRMLMAIEDQKKIMLSLKEERKITAMISDQQTILQAIQSLQVKVSALNATVSVTESNE